MNKRCGIHVRRQWSCFSFRKDAPFIAWFPSEDLFKRNLYPVALLRRYPCSEAKVTPRAFGEAKGRFPTRRQLLADDVLRCHLLGRGNNYVDVEQLLGPPDEREPEGGSILFVFFLGPERDSFFQMDPELLLIELSHGKVVYIAIVQG